MVVVGRGGSGRAGSCALRGPEFTAVGALGSTGCCRCRASVAWWWWGAPGGGARACGMASMGGRAMLTPPGGLPQAGACLLLSVCTVLLALLGCGCARASGCQRGGGVGQAAGGPLCRSQTDNAQGPSALPDVRQSVGPCNVDRRAGADGEEPSAPRNVPKAGLVGDACGNHSLRVRYMCL